MKPGRSHHRTGGADPWQQTRQHPLRTV